MDDLVVRGQSRNIPKREESARGWEKKKRKGGERRHS